MEKSTQNGEKSGRGASGFRQAKNTYPGPHSGEGQRRQKGRLSRHEESSVWKQLPARVPLSGRIKKFDNRPLLTTRDATE